MNLKQQIIEKQRLNKASDTEMGVVQPAQFRGWHSRGYLPHFDGQCVIQMLSFRLHDAMPASRRREWEALLKIEDDRERRIQIECYLDTGYGACHLKNPQVATVVENAMLHFDNSRYRLIAWVVMPNHVHALLEIWTAPLETIASSWKSFTAKEANKLLNHTGTFWQEDYWDRYIRDENHFAKALRYIEWNPVKAGLVSRPEDWEFSSANPRWNWSDSRSSARYSGAYLIREDARADETSALLF